MTTEMPATIRAATLTPLDWLANTFRPQPEKLCALLNSD